MRHSDLAMVGLLLVAGLPLSACEYSRASAKSQLEHPAQVKRVDGTEHSVVTMTERASQRLGLKTDQVREEKETRKNQPLAKRKVVTYSAPIYYSQDQSWA